MSVNATSRRFKLHMNELTSDQVCSPPPREGEQDHEGIWRGLEDGTFTVLSSDHCPFLYDDSDSGKKSVITAEYPNGHFRYVIKYRENIKINIDQVHSERLSRRRNSFGPCFLRQTPQSSETCRGNLHQRCETLWPLSP